MHGKLLCLLGMAGLCLVISLPVSGGGKKSMVQPAIISAADVVERIKQKNAMLIVDVREAEELQGPLGALPGVVNTPLSQLDQHLTQIPKAKDVWVICRSGARSQRAIGVLQAKGYTRLWNVTGGMMAVRQIWPLAEQCKGE